eukprot:2293939-Rhodomonas_salina.5
MMMIDRCYPRLRKIVRLSPALTCNRRRAPPPPPPSHPSTTARRACCGFSFLCGSCAYAHIVRHSRTPTLSTLERGNSTKKDLVSYHAHHQQGFWPVQCKHRKAKWERLQPLRRYSHSKGPNASETGDFFGKRTTGFVTKEGDLCMMDRRESTSSSLLPVFPSVSHGSKFRRALLPQ